MTVDITYCTAWGYKGVASGLAGAIRKIHGDAVSVTMTKGSGGIFDVVINGEMAFRKFDTGRFPTQPEILEKVAAKLKNLWGEMFLARVTGSVVATQKVKSMIGHKLLIVEPLRVDPATRDKLIGIGRSFVVVDSLGAGLGEMVLIVQGSSARLTPETDKLLVDATIIGIVDSVNVENRTIFSARQE